MLQLDDVYSALKRENDLSHMSEFAMFVYKLNLNRIASYLGDRRQFVCFKNKFSSPFPTVSGVPQGSKLGPMVFLLAISESLITLFTASSYSCR